MYGHRYSGNIAFSRPVRFGSTNEGLAAAATAQAFGDVFARAARLSRADDRRMAANNRHCEARRASTKALTYQINDAAECFRRRRGRAAIRFAACAGAVSAELLPTRASRRRGNASHAADR